MSKILHSLLLNEWKNSVHKGDFESACAIDFRHYSQVVKASESQEMWDKWQEDTFQHRKTLTKKAIQKSPSVKQSGKPLIVHYNFSGLAHEQQLTRNLRFLGIEADVVYLHGPQNTRSRDFTTGDAYFLNAKGHMEAARGLETLSKRYGSLIYVTVYPMAFWSSLICTHGNQKFLQMKYAPRQTGRIVQWAGGRKDTQKYYKVNGEDFLQLSILAPHGIEVEKKDRQTFGSISRTEKIIYPEYIELVQDLRKTGWEYLYTADRQVMDGINLGWVDPQKTIGEFGIYLETFPWGGGEMTLLALESGIPYLTLDTPENRRTGMYSFLQGIGGPDFSFCQTKEELKQRFTQLTQDKELRDRVGEDWKTAIKHYNPTDAAQWREFLCS